MVLNYLFTGLLAALLSVPGTGQKEVATVGEEPVVKKEVPETAYWRYKNSTTDGAKEAENYEPIPNDQGSCGAMGGVPCILQIDGEPEDVTDLQNFLNTIPSEALVAAQALHTKQ